MLDNLTLCLYSTTKGHWDIKNRYLETIKDLNNYELNFAEKIAHIKITPGDEDLANQMEKDFVEYGFRVLKTVGEWKHFHGSHSIEQLKDIFTVYLEVKTDFIFHLEDDWLIRPLNDNFQAYLEQAMNLIQNNPNILQVRIPRHPNEFEHYKTIEKVDDNFNRQKEVYSLNPHVVFKKTLEIFLASIYHQQKQIIPLLDAQQLNAELLFAEIGKQLSKEDKPYWSFSEKNIRALHIGSKLGEEDKLD